LAVRRDRLLQRLVRERFVVTLKSGDTFDGLLDELDDHTVVLVDPYAVTERARTSVDGKMYLPRDHVAYMQRPDRP
jgi:small nuclear ribonucleoprotein (snRNP)-like protein